MVYGHRWCKYIDFGVVEFIGASCSILKLMYNVHQQQTQLNSCFQLVVSAHCHPFGKFWHQTFLIFIKSIHWICIRLKCICDLTNWCYVNGLHLFINQTFNEKCIFLYAFWSRFFSYFYRTHFLAVLPFFLISRNIHFVVIPFSSFIIHSYLYMKSNTNTSYFVPCYYIMLRLCCGCWFVIGRVGWPFTPAQPQSMLANTLNNNL